MADLDAIIRNAFTDWRKLYKLIALANQKGEHPVLGLQLPSTFRQLPTKEKEIAALLRTIYTPASLGNVKDFITSRIEGFQKVGTRPVFHGNVPFFLYALYLIDSLEKEDSNRTLAFLNGVISHSILDQTCSTVQGEIPPDIAALVHHHIYDEKRGPSEREKRYNVPMYVVVTCCGEEASAVYRLADKKAVEIGTIPHSPEIQNQLLLRRKPHINYEADNEFLRFTVTSDYQLRYIAVYKVQRPHLAPVDAPTFFSEPTSTGVYYAPLSEVKDSDTLFAFAFDEHYRASVVARFPAQRISLKDAGRPVF